MAAPQSLQRLLYPVYRSLEESVHMLRYLFLEVTQRCNLSCRHCGSDCGSQPRLEELTTDEWLAFFDYLAERFDTRELLAVVTGGEPLCCPRIEDLLGRLKKNGLTWGMVSNGWALDPKRMDMLMQQGLHSLTISLDGIESSHDWLRGREGSFARAVQALKLAVTAGVPVLDVVTCVNPRNLSQLPEVMALLRDIGVPKWRLFTIFPKGRAKTDPSVRPSEDQIRELMAWIANQRRAVEDSDFIVEYCCEGYLPKDVDATVRDQPYFCRAGINIASVLCDGAVSACPNITRSLVQGNIRTHDFHTLWEQEFKPFRHREWMKRGPCTQCKEWKRCQGNSLHLWDDETEQTVLCHHRVLRDKGVGHHGA